MKRQITGIVLAMALLGADAAPDPAKQEMQAIQGTWAIVTAEQDGKADDSGKKTTVVIQGNQFATKVADTAMRRGTLTLGPSQTPKAIDLTYSDGPQKGKTSPGIYSLNGDFWILVFSIPGKDRPANFDRNTGNGARYMVLSRQGK